MNLSAICFPIYMVLLLTLFFVDPLMCVQLQLFFWWLHNVSYKIELTAAIYALKNTCQQFHQIISCKLNLPLQDLRRYLCFFFSTHKLLAYTRQKTICTGKGIKNKAFPWCFPGPANLWHNCLLFRINVLHHRSHKMEVESINNLCSKITSKKPPHLAL